MADEFEFQPEHDGSLPIENAVGQAIGAASTCWESLSGTGVFDEARARAITGALLKRIDTECVLRQPKALLGMATTRELLEEVEARMRLTQNSTRGRHLAELCREASANLDPQILGYSAVRD